MRWALYFAYPLMNWSVDRNDRVIYVDDDDEGPERLVEWIKGGVRQVFAGDDDARLEHIQEYAQRMRAISGSNTSAAAMIEIYEYASWLSAGWNQWAYDVRQVVTGSGQGREGFDHNVRGFGPYFVGGWSDTGFKAKYRDGGNQVSHFGAVFLVVNHSLGFTGEDVNYQTSESPNGADWYFNIEIGRLARDLREGGPWSDYQGTGKVRRAMVSSLVDFGEVGVAPGTQGRPGVRRPARD